LVTTAGATETRRERRAHVPYVTAACARIARGLSGSVLLAVAVATATVPAARGADMPPRLLDDSRPGLLDDNRQPPSEDFGADGIRALGGALSIGGDVTIAASVLEDGPSSLEVDDVNLLLRYEPHPRLAFFSETRLENSLSIAEGDGTDSSPDVAIERLYVDWYVGSGVTLRAGKFLTPFGIWNVTRRAPLTWTVERPIVTDVAFPEHTTGVSALYETTIHAWSLDAIAYGPAQDELPLRSSEEDDRLLAGGRVALGHGLGPAFLTVGLNGAAAEHGETEHMRGLYGADLELNVAGHQVMAEIASAQADGGDGSDLWGFYLQDAIPVFSTVYGVVRFEHFAPPQGRASDGGLIGVWWRPWRHLIVKADYQFVTEQREDLQRGLLTSVALFF
jgi:hypothetical protein